MDRFADKVVVVTGAGSGIGRATAIRFGREGGSVACLDVVEDGAAQTAKEVEAVGGKAKSYRCDVSDEASVNGTVAQVVSDFGKLDVVCNIAGVGRFNHTTETSLDEWDRIIGVNLTGTFLVCRATIPHLLGTGGNIVNTASTAGVRAQPFSAAYAASKGGVAIMSRALAWEYIERGIRINAIAPGGVKTPLIDNFGFPEGANVKLFDKITSPLGFMDPDYIASLFVYVASDDARYMTGSVVVMDGGITT